MKALHAVATWLQWQNWQPITIQMPESGIVQEMNQIKERIRRKHTERTHNQFLIAPGGDPHDKTSEKSHTKRILGRRHEYETSRSLPWRS